MHFSETSLPPRVAGSPRGFLTLSFGDLQLHGTLSASCSPAVRVVWWGCEEKNADCVPVCASQSSLSYIVRSGPEHLAQYLKDATCLDMQIISLRNSQKPLGRLSLDVYKAFLQVERLGIVCPVECPSTGEVLGSLVVSLGVSYKPQPQNKSGYRPSPPELVVCEERRNADDDADENYNLFIASGSLPNTALEEVRVAADAAAVEIAGLPVQTPIIDAHPGSAVPVPESAPAEEAPPDFESSYRSSGEETAVNNTSEDRNVPLTGHVVQDAHEDGGLRQLPPSRSLYLTIRIDSAFHLSPEQFREMPSNRDDENNRKSRFMLYASTGLQQERHRRRFTHVTSVHDIPPIGFAAVWDEEVTIDIDSEVFIREAAEQWRGDGGGGGILDGPLLLLNVWRFGAEDRFSSAAERRVGQQTVSDRLIGCAALDLSPLLREDERKMSGRYPLVSAGGEVQGVIKAHVQLMGDLRKVSASPAVVGRAGRAYQSDTKKDENTSAGAAGIAVEVTTSSMEEVESIHKDANFGAGICLGGMALDVEAPDHHHTTGKGVSEDRRPLSPSPSPACISSSRSVDAAKVKYAWSGSESDDEDPMIGVGMFLEGAVSCSESDDEACEKDEALPRQQLITQDWLFDISRSTGSPKQSGILASQEQEAKDDDENEGVPRAMSPKSANFAAETSTTLTHKRVSFKNKLLPAVVDGAGMETELPAVFGFGSHHASPASLQSHEHHPPQSRERFTTSAGLEQTASGGILRDGESDAWLWSIGRSSIDPGGIDPPPPPRFACNQFEPMGRKNTLNPNYSSPEKVILQQSQAHSQSGPGPGPGSIHDGRKPTTSPTLTEVLESLSLRRE